MTDRQRTIVEELQIEPTDIWYLGIRTGAPEASVRRDIQALRRQGFNIVATAPHSVYSRYELRAN